MCSKPSQPWAILLDIIITKLYSIETVGENMNI